MPTLRKPTPRKAAFKAADIPLVTNDNDRRIPLIVLAALAAVMALVLVFTQCTGGSAPAPTSTDTSEAVSSEAAEAQVEEEIEPPSNPSARDSLSDYTWEELSAISEKISLASTEDDALYIAKQYNLVDSSGILDASATKTVSLADGSNEEVRIIGFNHDNVSDGTGKAGLTFMFSDGIVARPINEDGSNTGGWASSSASYYLGVEFWGLLPEDLTSAIKEVTKVSNTAEEGSVAETGDIMWLPSYIEIAGQVDAEVQAQAGTLQQEGTQYQLFKDAGVSASGNNSLLVMHDGAQASAWWLRSADVTNEGAYCYVNAAGHPSGNGAASESYLLVPCFCV